MTTTTHTLEGPDLEALLARVPAEHGPEAVIVAANKLRSGGIGGFFAKEGFEVVVEVPDAVAESSEPSVERDLHEAPRAAAPSAPRISTEAAGFAGVLERMVRDAGIEDQGPRLVGPAMTRDPAVSAVAAEPATVAEPEGEAERFEPLATVRVDRAEVTTVGAQAEPAAPMMPAAPAAPAMPAAPATPMMPAAPAAPMMPTVTAAHSAVPEGTTTAAATMLPVSPLRSTPGAPANALAVQGPISPALDQRWLARIGLPTNVAARLSTVSADPTIELLHLMEQVTRPDPLPSTGGAVIAIVGKRAEALEVCAQFAEQLGINPEEVLVAAAAFRGGSIAQERRITTIELAQEQRRSWRRRPRPTIVAVEASLGRSRTGWATHVLDALEPTMVWGVVEASRKVEDIRDWAQRLGGLDALAVTGLDDTVSPATVLGAGVPVGLLDGHEATASRWTAVLAEHLEVAA